jgi:TrmH family RNA methyltransferase
LIDPCPVGDEARRRAKHANYILDDAVTIPTLEDAMVDASMVVGTSGIVSFGEKHYVRIPMTPHELRDRMKGFEGTVVLLFGREDQGLFHEELQRCDMLVHIPADQGYPVLNLSHAVAVVLYELHSLAGERPSPTDAEELERDKLFEFFADLLDAIDYPEFRRERTKMMFRRMMGRAVPTKWEFYTIMGVLSDATKLIRKGKD